MENVSETNEVKSCSCSFSESLCLIRSSFCGFHLFYTALTFHFESTGTVVIVSRLNRFRFIFSKKSRLIFCKFTYHETSIFKQNCFWSVQSFFFSLKFRISHSLSQQITHFDPLVLIVVCVLMNKQTFINNVNIILE